MSDKCPKCGAGGVSYGDAGPRYACGRIGKTEFGDYTLCLRRQLAARDAEIVRLTWEQQQHHEAVKVWAEAQRNNLAKIGRLRAKLRMIDAIARWPDKAVACLEIIAEAGEQTGGAK